MKRMSRRQFVRYSLAGAAGMAAAHMTGPLSALAQEEDKRAVLNVGYLPISDHLILPVSHALHGAAYKHVRVNPMLCLSWDEILGKVDMGMLQAAFMLAPLAMHETFMGTPLRCVLLGHTNGSALAAKPSVKQAKDLLGRTIGIPHARSTHRVLLYKFLKDSKVENMNETRLVMVPPPLTVKSMKAGKIDAFCVAEPWGRAGVSAGVAGILAYSKNILADHVCCLVMLEKRFIEKHTDAAAEWVGSLQETGRIIHDDPDRAGELQAPYMNHKPDAVAGVVKNKLVSYEKLFPSRQKLEVMHDLSRECGVLDEDCDLAKLVITDFAK